MLALLPFLFYAICSFVFVRLLLIGWSGCVQGAFPFLLIVFVLVCHLFYRIFIFLIYLAIIAFNTAPEKVHFNYKIELFLIIVSYIILWSAAVFVLKFNRVGSHSCIGCTTFQKNWDLQCNTLIEQSSEKAALLKKLKMQKISILPS